MESKGKMGALVVAFSPTIQYLMYKIYKYTAFKIHKIVGLSFSFLLFPPILHKTRQVQVDHKS